MLDVDKLATLREVIARGSFSAAATALSLTQPAVSRQVSVLEARLGTQLVRRTRQGVLATEAGALLVGTTHPSRDRERAAGAGPARDPRSDRAGVQTPAVRRSRYPAASTVAASGAAEVRGVVPAGPGGLSARAQPAARQRAEEIASTSSPT
jgi:hypothetical protein